MDFKKAGRGSKVERITLFNGCKKSSFIFGDLERKIGRISIPNCHPRDLLQLAESLSWSLKTLSLANNQNSITTLKSLILTTQSVRDKIQKTLRSQVPLQIKDGHFIKKGVCPQLDELTMFMENAHKRILAIETRERQNLNISNLKVRHNNVFGYILK